MLTATGLFLLYLHIQHFCDYSNRELLTDKQVDEVMQYFIDKECEEYKSAMHQQECFTTLAKIKQDFPKCFGKLSDCYGNITYFNADKRMLLNTYNEILNIQSKVYYNGLLSAISNYINSKVYLQIKSYISSNPQDVYIIETKCELNYNNK
jgi:hypothetical protein